MKMPGDGPAGTPDSEENRSPGVLVGIDGSASSTEEVTGGAVDIRVVGRRGMLLGSVSKSVVEGAQTPVVVVPPDAAARRIGDGKELLMKANVGDWLVIKGSVVDRPDRRGLITEVHSSDGAPPYVVRWLDTDHVTTVFPGPDAIVVSAEEQRNADERARHRFGAIQSTIHRSRGSGQGT